MTFTVNDHATCAETFRNAALQLGSKCTVSTLPPLVPGPYTTAPFICLHGTAFWIEPTGEQIAEWVKGGVA